MAKRQAADIVVPDVEILDVSLTEMITRRRYVIHKHGTTEEEAQDPLPEEIMSMLDELTGDAKGRVTVGAELASSIEFGFKAGAFVSIGVSCDSSEEAIEGVHDILHGLAQKLVVDDHAKMSELRDSMLSKDQQLGSRAPTNEKGKSAARPKRSKKTKGRFRRGG
jgi:hypothetical protein